MLGKKKEQKQTCVAVTKCGERCKRQGNLDENNLCYTHRNYDKAN